MARLNKTCYACQKKYSYCPSCSRVDAMKPSWSSEFCSESCKDLWTALTKYNMSMLSKSEAKSIISELDLKPIDTYADCVKRDYKVIMTEEKKSRRAHKKPEPVVDIEVEQPIIVAESMAIEPESHVVVIEKENE